MNGMNSVVLAQLMKDMKVSEKKREGKKADDMAPDNEILTFWNRLDS
jgi:hypothetical protein